MQSETAMHGSPSSRQQVPGPSEAWWETDPLAAGAGLTARTAGSGPDVVLVHGSVGDYRQWDPIACQLRGDYRLTALSRRFHWPHALAAAPRGPRNDAALPGGAGGDRPLPGPSAPPAGAYTYEAHRDDLVRYLRLRDAPVHLVGHSYGAGIVLLAALAEPALLHSIVLIEPAFNSLLPDEAAGLEEELASRDAMAASVRSLAASGQHDAAARCLIDWVQGGPGTFAMLPGWVQTAMRENAITAGATLAHRAPDVTCADLKRCHVPALVVTGEVTRLYYRLIASRAAGCLAEAASASLPGAAHMTIVERPVEAAAVLSGFCQAGKR